MFYQLQKDSGFRQGLKDDQGFVYFGRNHFKQQTTKYPSQFYFNSFFKKKVLQRKLFGQQN